MSGRLHKAAPTANIGIEITLLGVLAALWGASFAFIKLDVATRHMSRTIRRGFALSKYGLPQLLWKEVSSILLAIDPTTDVTPSALRPASQLLCCHANA